LRKAHGVTVVFIDTNVLLHYLRPDQIDWLKLTGAQHVRIILTRVVVGELDSHKQTHHSQKIRQRAREVCAYLSNSFAPASPSDPVLIRPGVELMFASQETLPDWHTLGLDSSINDDRVLAAVIDYKRTNTADPVVVVTCDLGMSLKAKSRGIRVLEPADDDKLREEADPRDKQIHQLQTELGRLKNAIPELSLRFLGGGERFTFRLTPPAGQNPQQIASDLHAVRVKYPKLKARDPKEIRKTPFRKLLETPLSDLATTEDIVKYNEALESFYLSYERYLTELAQFENVKRRAIELPIEVHNSGRAPAEDIGIQLHFPDGFSLYDSKKTKILPGSPVPPEPPRQPGTFRAPRFNESIVALRPPGPAPNVSALKIERSHSYDVKCHVQRLKHTYSTPLHGILIVFDSFESAKPFQIDYIVDAANMPSRGSGVLTVLLEKEKGAIPPAPNERDGTASCG
jgi:rRNA-processing protein FCF1